MILQVIGILFLVPAALICMYYLGLALFALLGGKEPLPSGGEPRHRFAIVIPAHNEEEIIGRVLHSCAQLDYPSEKYQVFVIADNCSDGTCRAARAGGAVCLERQDQERRGKGFALEWGFARILPRGYDALVVLDADCRLDSQALRVFDYYLQQGFQALQANDVASNPDITTMSYAVAVGNLIENLLFYGPKSRLGLAVFLRGTGMVFLRDLLERYPWKAHSIAEDVEYTLGLLRRGIRVKFVEQVRVLSEFPVNKEQLRIQRTRWASGNLGFSKTHALKLMREGVVKRQGLLLDAGWTLLVLSRPLVLLELLVALVLSFFCWWLYPGVLSQVLLAGGLIIALLQGLYWVLGIVLLGINLRRMALLLGAPLVVARLVLISFGGLLGVNKHRWARTPR